MEGKQVVLCLDVLDGYRLVELQVGFTPGLVQIHAVDEVGQVGVSLRVQQALGQLLELRVENTAGAALALVWAAVDEVFGSRHEDEEEVDALEREPGVGVDE